MKSIKILLISLLILSCSANDDDCNCEKETYRYNQYTVTGSNGLPHLTFDKEVLSIETVNCQDEQDQVSQGNGVYFNITCD